MSKFLFLFPGQGAQYRGMGEDLFLNKSVARRTYEEANDILGYDLADVSFHDEKEQLTSTRYTQPALLAHSVACMRSFSEDSSGCYKAEITAGHSLGEYSALVAAGYLTFATALALVQKRGELMSMYGKGEMVAVPIARNIAEPVATKHFCGISACNLPEQTVIGGLPGDIDKVLSRLRESHPQLKSTRLQTEGAFHTYYMVEAAIYFRPFLEAVEFEFNTANIMSNFSGTFHERDTNSIRANLFLQLFHPVLWHQNLSDALDSGITNIIEFGGGIGKGDQPNNKKPNLASIVKRTLRGLDNPPQYHSVINLESLNETISSLE